MSKRTRKSIRVSGRVIDCQTCHAIPGLDIEVWGKGVKCDELIGTATTNEHGTFRVKISAAEARERFLDPRPTPFIKVFRDGQLLKNTEEVMLWEAKPGLNQVVIEVGCDTDDDAVPANQEELASEDQDCPSPDEEPAQETHIVRGQIMLVDGGPLDGATVKAVDVDFRRREPLGEAVLDGDGNFELAYRAAQIARAEKKGADLRIQVFSAQGELLAESDTRYNAGQTETINLTVPAPPPPAELSEIERIETELKPLIHASPFASLNNEAIYASFNSEDIDFLVHELAGVPEIRERSLNLLAQSARLTQETAIPTEFFYGVARVRQLQLPLTLDSLIALQPAEILLAARQAIENRIVPPGLEGELERIGTRLGNLRLERGLLLKRTFEGRLLKAGSGEPIAGYTIQASHELNNDANHLGSDVTDRRGTFAFSTITSAELSDLGHIKLTLLDAEGATLHQAEFALQADGDDIVNIDVPVNVLPQPPAKPLSELATELNLNLSNAVLQDLAQHNVRTVSDILRVGGIDRLDGLADNIGSEMVSLLNAQAKLSLVSPDSKLNAALIQKGYTSLRTIARKPLNAFVADVVEMQEISGEAEAYRIGVAALTQARILDGLAAEARLRIAEGNGSMPDFVEELDSESRSIFEDDCSSCEDCDAAVSPRAYFLDLLKYTTEHIRTRPWGFEIDLDYLTTKLHQPFGDFLDTCDFTEKKLRQVRICVEVLREHLGARPVTPPDQERLLSESEKQYRLATYSALLTKLGTSLPELRRATGLEQEERLALKERLGIYLSEERPSPPEPDHLDQLYLDPRTGVDGLSEADIETLFGLVDTNRDVLSNAPTEGDTDGQIRRIELEGVVWNKNTDAEGFIYLTLTGGTGMTRLSLYKDADSSILVAEGIISASEGEVRVNERNRSGLSGRFLIRYTADSSAIALSAIPRFQSWRMQYLRTVWQEQDWPSDPYFEELLPVIDPDLIGPDDFRHPEVGSPPFDLWVARREWVDSQLAALEDDSLMKDGVDEVGNPIRVPDPEALLDHMYTAVVSYDGTPLDPAWDSATPKSRFPQIRRTLTGGQEEEIEAVTTELEDNLKLTPAAFSRLLEIRDKDVQASRDSRAAQVGDDEWQEFYNILVQSKKRHIGQTWRTEEQSSRLVFGPKSFWVALTEPEVGPWNAEVGAESNRPLIDPDLVGLQDLPDPTAGSAARALWEAREADLKNDLEELQRIRDGETEPIAAFEAILLHTFGSAVDLVALNNALNGNDEAAAERAEQRIQNELHLILDDFRRLVTLQQKNAEGAAPLSSAEWSDVDRILNAAHKKRVRYPNWITEESGLPYWRALKARLPRWRAEVEARQIWKAALRIRSLAPLINPDLIDTDYLASRLAGEEAALPIWNARYESLRREFARLQSEREVPGTDSRDWLISTLSRILDVPDPAALFEELSQAEAEGERITARLSQLNLSRPAFAHLRQIVQALESTPPATILDSEWEDAYHILIQVWKAREYETWLAEERTQNIILSPDHFKLPEPKPFTFPPEEPTPPIIWRFDRRVHRDWEDRLEARLDQQRAAIDGLREAVSNTEEETLPLLRDALIQAIDQTPNRPFPEKAELLAQQLLIDTQDSGCRVTTRVGQAIETLQDLIWSHRTGQLAPLYTDLLPLDDDGFDEEWTWMGSYATWRAAMFVFIYPENLLMPGLKRWQTPGFQEFLNSTRNNRRLSPEQACEAAQRYSAYLRDVANLKIEATCSAMTFMRQEACTGRETPVSGMVRALHLFAQSTVTRGLYWSIYSINDNPEYNHSFWQSLDHFENVVKIIGAVPYEIDTEQRYIYLFAQVQKFGEQQLVYDRLNLETGGWEKQINELDLDFLEESATFTAVVKQTVFGDQPPQLAIRVESGAIYILSMNLEGTDWAEDEPLPIGKPLDIVNVLAMVEVSTREYYLIAQDEDNRYRYRLFDAYDDGGWRQISYPGSSSTFLGVFSHPATENVYLFSDDGGTTSCYQLRRNRPEAMYEVVDGVIGLHTWLWSHAGVSLLLLPIPDSDEDRGTIPISPLLEGLNERSTEYIRYIVEDLIEEDSPRGRQWKRAAKMVERFARQPLGLALLTAVAGGGVQFLRFGDTTEWAWERRDDASLSGLQWIASYSTTPIARDPESSLILAYQRSGRNAGPWRTAIELTGENDRISFVLPERLTPVLNRSFNIPERLIGREFHDRRTETSSVFSDNDGEPLSTLTYLEEAYYFIPMHLALQLQQQGHYVNALDWFRTVYDYGRASPALEDRRIYPLLTQDLPIIERYRRLENWLLDPLNVHEIARTRADAYTRFTLMAIVRCLLAYADAEFTFDTGESVTKAREMYTTALDLIGLPALQQLNAGCENLVARLLIDLSTTISAEAPEWVPAFEEVVHPASSIGDPRNLERLANQIMERAAADEPLEERLFAIREMVTSETEEAAEPSRLSTLVTEIDEAHESAHTALLTSEEIAERTSTAGGTAAGHLVLATDVDETAPMTVRPPRHTATLPFGFCVPPNPILEALQLHAELNLYKIRTCRNIAGMERQLEPYAAPTDRVTGLPQIGAGGNIILPGTTAHRPTPYRYSALIERAKQLVQFANQTEAAMLAAIEKHDAEAYSRLTARQTIEQSRAGLRLQSLRLTEAKHGVKLAELQRERAQLQVDHYQELLDQGLLANEALAIAFMYLTALFNVQATFAFYSSAAANAAGMASGLSSTAQALSTTASIFQTLASYERRRQQWEFDKTIAQQDVRIGAQQIRLAEDRVRIVGQEHKIAKIQTDHAKEAQDYLANKFTNVELYDWMSDVLEGVYSYFLQEATSLARLAEAQLAFERQETPPAIIQADYWEAPSDSFIGIGQGNSPDRRGLTGSARLLQDIVELDQFAFDTDQRKLQLSKTISLASLSPAEFQRFRETGLMRFDTPMNLFDRDFPGHYLRLIKRVRTSVIALIPPNDGIRATLTVSGLSRVVIGGDIFQLVPVRRQPESVALSAPRDATGLFELVSPQQQEMLLPFEGMGVDTSWELRMPKAANLFDYSTIADVLLTVEYTALDSYSYRQQVLYELDQTMSADRPFSFRQEFADQWYDLNNPQLTDPPLTVKFQTRREDFPPNVDELKIQHVALYFSRNNGTAFEVPVSNLQFTEPGSAGSVGGSAKSIDGIISTRRGNAGRLTGMIGKSPIGEWELALVDTPQLRDRFTNEELDDILLVITYKGRVPAWPA